MGTLSVTKSLLYLVLIWLWFNRFGLADDAAFFEAKVRPILVEHCLDCHSSEDVQQGGLALDSKAGWLVGGNSGPALIPGNADESRLIQAVRGDQERIQMPPVDSGYTALSAAQLAVLVQWVEQGAYDPRTSTTSTAGQAWEQAYAERRRWWSLQPLTASKVAKLASQGFSDNNWSSTIDSYLYHKMREEGVTPSESADANTLLRRATLTLTGLPPTVEQTTQFLEDCQVDCEQAYQHLIDRLLSSHDFGERFARHWLDVVRFTETHGNEWNYDYPFAWRYRDYVIRAFNEDLPFDQFAREHIAGDLIRPRIVAQHNESAIGTAFYRFGEVNHDSCVQFSVIGYDIVDNQLDTLTKAFQATTVACARCHDHKLDAVSTRDYHALLGVLRSSRSVQRTLDTPQVNRQATATLQQLKRDLRRELSRIWLTDARTIDAARLDSAVAKSNITAAETSHPLQRWCQLSQLADDEIVVRWQPLADELRRTSQQRHAENEAQFVLLADLREGVPEHWTTDGLGLRDGGPTNNVSFDVAHTGDAIIGALLPRGLYTYGISKKLNGALRSNNLQRTHSKVSFEVLGGRFSLARLVFNNCQLNYNHQHSIHHADWSWITIDFPEGTQDLRPYLELLTLWDNPKFPDPLGTLGKDTENQREPYAVHAADPRSWWGIRRIVVHDVSSTPQDELTHLARLDELPPPTSKAELATRYSDLTSLAAQRFADDQATDDDARWLNGLLHSGLLSNALDQQPSLQALVQRYRTVEQSLQLPTMMPGLSEEGEGFDQPLLLRGDHLKPSEPVSRSYIAALMPETDRQDTPLGRRELAELIASAENPLTARVYVNRVWQWIFGRGLVATPDDFGHLGELPTHPQLLDRLAADFVAQGWSTKRLIREMLLTRAFRCSNRPTESSRTLDPDNRWLSHFAARRVEAEVIRDCLLAVSGRLDRQLGGPSVHPYRVQADPDKRLYVGPLDGDGRRSIYLKFQLMEAPHFLREFNLPGGKVAQGRRDATNVPAQSLAMLNDPLVIALADQWAGQLIQDNATSIEARIDAMFGAALGRLPTESQRQSFAEAILQLSEAEGGDPSQILKQQSIWKDAAHLLFNLAEFRFVL